MLAALVLEAPSPEATPAGAATVWVSEYLQSHRPSDDWETAVLAGRPYVHETEPGAVYLALRSFSFWLRTAQGERVTSRDLSRFLRMAGFEQYNQNVPEGEGRKPTTRSVYRGPLPL